MTHVIPSVVDAATSLPTNLPVVQDKRTDVILKINFCTIGKDAFNGLKELGKFAGKSLAGLAVVVLNLTSLSVLYAGKLLGFSILPAIILGGLNTGLTIATNALADYTWAPLKDWTNAIACENNKMLNTASNVFSGSFKDTEISINFSKWGELFVETGKAIVAPVSTTLNAATAAVFVGTKPAYLALFLPGVALDHLAAPLFWLNKTVSKCSFKPLQIIATNLEQIQRRVKYETDFCNCMDQGMTTKEREKAYGSHLPDQYKNRG